MAAGAGVAEGEYLGTNLSRGWHVEKCAAGRLLCMRVPDGATRFVVVRSGRTKTLKSAEEEEGTVMVCIVILSPQNSLKQRETDC